MSASTELRAALAAALALAPLTAQQGPRLDAAVAGAAQRGGVPAIEWLCEQYLPSLPSWPDGLDPRGPFSLTLSADGIRVGPTEVAVPDGAVAIGSCVFAGGDDSAPLLWRCDVDGREQWVAPADLQVPAHHGALLGALEADVLDTARTLDVPVLVAHLTGATVDGDPRAAMLRLLPALCGDVTWMASIDGDRLRVTGRSEGGLTLPLALLATAAAAGAGEVDALALRAFAARDADRAEAARQLGRADRELDVATLRALLRGDDPVRLTAVDALIRRGAAEELPRIVESADVDMAWTTVAARDALRALWPAASPAAKQATRAALQRSDNTALRRVDLDALERGAAPPARPTAAAETVTGRARLLLLLLCVGVGLLGLCARERSRRIAAAIA